MEAEAYIGQTQNLENRMTRSAHENAENLFLTAKALISYKKVNVSFQGHIRILVSAFVCAGLLVAVGSASVTAQGLISDCVPLGGIGQHRPIDDNCPARGEVPDPPVEANDAAHALQNLAKNNFCATGVPALVTFTTFKKLQQVLEQNTPVSKTWGREHLPDDRDVLRSIYTTSEGATIGEGTVVTFAAWLLKIRKGGAETCNCGQTNGTAKGMIDMHLVLVSSWDRDRAPECSSVTAEVPPHYRPDVWDGETLLSALSHPLRITGQLMYDASHRPCSGDPLTPGSRTPARISSWEIHPVYAIDVCKKKSLNSCKADDDSAWTPLDQWQEGE